MQLERQFNKTGEGKLDKERSKLEFMVKELDFIREKTRLHEAKEDKRQQDMIDVVSKIGDANKDYNSELKKWSKEANMTRKEFERLLKAYLSNGESLEGLKYTYIIQPEDPEVVEREKQIKKAFDQCEKDLRHNRLQINRIKTEIRNRSIDLQKDIARFNKEIESK